MREHDRMRLRMRQVEGAAEHMAELVVKRHRGRSEAHAGRATRHIAPAMRASKSCGAPMTAGSAEAKARSPSSAIISTIGFRSRA